MQVSSLPEAKLIVEVGAFAQASMQFNRSQNKSAGASWPGFLE